MAVKIIPFELLNKNPEFFAFLRRELDILKKIQHQNIVRLYHASRTTRNLYMFLEYCCDGDLKVLFIFYTALKNTYN